MTALLDHGSHCIVLKADLRGLVGYCEVPYFEGGEASGRQILEEDIVEIKAETYNEEMMRLAGIPKEGAKCLVDRQGDMGKKS